MLGDETAFVVLNNIALTRKKTLKLHGVRDGSRFIHSRSAIAKVKYDGEDGLLHVIHDDRSKITFNIGCGYSLLGFRVRRNMITYNGENSPASKRMPAVYKCS